MRGDAIPMAATGIDTDGDGRPNLLYVGADRDLDGVPDALQSKRSRPLAEACGPPNMAAAGIDTSGDGRANLVYVGADRNCDGVPDALQSRGQLVDGRRTPSSASDSPAQGQMPLRRLSPERPSRPHSPDIPIMDAVGARVLLTSRDTWAEDFVGLWERWAEATSRALRDGGEVPPPPAPPALPPGREVPPHLVARLTEAATFAAAFLAKGNANNRELRHVTGELEEELLQTREERYRLEELVKMLSSGRGATPEGRRLLGVPLWTPPARAGDGLDRGFDESPRGEGSPQDQDNSAAISAAAQKALRTTCPTCSSVFMADSVFCRRCGRRRPGAEHEVPWEGAGQGSGGGMPRELQRLQAALRDSEAGRLDLLVELRRQQEREPRPQPWHPRRPSDPDDRRRRIGSDDRPATPPAPTPVERTSLQQTKREVGVEADDGPGVAEMLELMSVHGDNQHMRAGASATLRRVGRVPPDSADSWTRTQKFPAAGDDSDELMSATLEDDDFYGKEPSESQRRSGEEARGRLSSERPAGFGLQPDSQDPGFRSPTTPESEPAERRPPEGRSSRTHSTRQPRPPLGLEFSDEEVIGGDKALGGLRAFTQGLDLQSLSSDSDSEEELLLATRGNSRGRFRANGGVMTALRRFDQEILDLCHALGGKRPQRRFRDPYTPSGKKKGGHRRVRDSSDDESPVRPGAGDKFGDLQKYTPASAQRLGDTSLDRVYVVDDSRGNGATPHQSLNDRVFVVDSGQGDVVSQAYDRSFDVNGGLSPRLPPNASPAVAQSAGVRSARDRPSREKPRAASDQAADAQAAEMRRKKNWKFYGSEEEGALAALGEEVGRTRQGLTALRKEALVELA